MAALRRALRSRMISGARSEELHGSGKSCNRMGFPQPEDVGGSRYSLQPPIDTHPGPRPRDAFSEAILLRIRRWHRDPDAAAWNLEVSVRERQRAPAEDLYNYFGITSEAIAAAVRKRLA